MAEGQRTLLEGLQCPYGMAFKDDYLYVAESTKVERFRHNNGASLGPAGSVAISAGGSPRPEQRCTS